MSILAALIESVLPKDSNRISISDGLILNDKKMRQHLIMIWPISCSIMIAARKIKTFAHKNLCPQSLAVPGTQVHVTDEVYGKIPKYYILCTESKDLDKSILPIRVKCEIVIEIKSSHSPFFSHPEELVNVLSEI